MNQPQPQVWLLHGKIHWMNRGSTCRLCMCCGEGVADYITLGFTLLRSLSFCFCSSNWRLFLSSSKSFCCCSNRFLKENIQGLPPVLIFIFLLMSSYISRTKNFSNVLILFWQSYFPTILISKYEFKKWFT